MGKDMSLQDTVYHLGHDFPGGVPALALRMACNPTVLMHKLNPNNVTHKLTVHELDALDDLTGSLLIAEHFAHKHGQLLVPCLNPADVDEDDLLTAFLQVTEEWGQFCSEYREAKADGKITKAEFKILKKRGLAVRARLVTLTDVIFHMVEE